mgnify:CR=1 FL=1
MLLLPFLGSTLDKVEKWMKNMALKGITRDEEKSMLFVNFKIDDKFFLVQTLVSKEWINIKALVALLKDIPKTAREDLFYNCLVANFNLHEVTYSADANGIWVEADMPVDTTESNFKVEFQSVVFGMKYFIEQIAPKAKFDIKDTTMFT